MAKYLDEQGLRTLWGKIKDRDTNTYNNAISEVGKVNSRLDSEITNRNNAIAAAKTAVKDDLLGGASAAFDTLKELAAALGDDPNFATTITNKVGIMSTEFDGKINNLRTELQKYADNTGKDAVSKTGTSKTSNEEKRYAISYADGVFKFKFTKESTGPLAGSSSKDIDLSYSGISYNGNKLLDTNDALTTAEIDAILV